MSNSRYISYSVFVGHIQPGTTRKDLLDLFSGCGPVVEAVVLEKEGSEYNYGFVRYREVSHALRAVAELHHWSLNGVNIVVDISKETAQKIKQEKLSSELVKAPVAPRTPTRSTSLPPVSRNIQDMMFLNRLRETCLLMKLTDSQGELNTNRLMTDISRSQYGHTSLWGIPSLENTSIEAVSEKVTKCCSRSESDTFHVFVETLVSDIKDVAEVEHLTTMKPESDQAPLTSGELSSLIEAGTPSDKVADIPAAYQRTTTMTSCSELQPGSQVNNSGHLSVDKFISKDILGKKQDSSGIETDGQFSDTCRPDKGSCNSTEPVSNSNENTVNNASPDSKENITLSKQEERLIKFLRSAMPYLDSVEDSEEECVNKLAYSSKSDAKLRLANADCEIESIKSILSGIDQVNDRNVAKKESKEKVSVIREETNEQYHSNDKGENPISLQSEAMNSVNHQTHSKIPEEENYKNSVLAKFVNSNKPAINFDNTNDIIDEVDPAILDFQVSRVSSPDNCSYELGSINSNTCYDQNEGSEVLNRLFANIKNGLPTKRESISIDSNSSEGSNDGSVEDSGFESDNLIHLLNTKTSSGIGVRIEPGRIPCGRGVARGVINRETVVRSEQRPTSVYKTGIGRQSSLRRSSPESIPWQRPGGLDNLVKYLGRGRHRHSSLR